MFRICIVFFFVFFVSVVMGGVDFDLICFVTFRGRMVVVINLFIAMKIP